MGDPSDSGSAVVCQSEQRKWSCTQCSASKTCSHVRAVCEDCEPRVQPLVTGQLGPLGLARQLADYFSIDKEHLRVTSVSKVFSS